MRARSVNTYKRQHFFDDASVLFDFDYGIIRNALSFIAIYVEHVLRRLPRRGSMYVCAVALGNGYIFINHVLRLVPTGCRQSLKDGITGSSQHGSFYIGADHWVT